VEKIRRRLELEKQELQAALEEAQAALEQEETKSARTQLELAAVRQEIDRRLAAKEEEFENTRLIKRPEVTICFKTNHVPISVRETIKFFETCRLLGYQMSV
jgi:hypothetical protein